MSGAARDPGGAHERTVMAWERTIPSALVCAGLAGRLGTHRGSLLLGAVAAAAALGVAVAAWWGAVVRSTAPRGGRPVPVRQLTGASALCGVFGAVACALLSP